MGLFEQYVKTQPQAAAGAAADAGRHRRAGSRLADTIAAHLGVRLSDKQQPAGDPSQVGERLELLVGLVDGEIDVQQLEKRIRGRVK